MIEVARVLQQPSFKRSFAKLSPLLRRRVHETIKKLRNAPELPGLHVEPVSGSNRDLWSCRVNKRIRIIFSRRDAGAIVLEQVAEHDAAYRAVTWTSLASMVGEGELTRAEGGRATVFDPDDLIGAKLGQALQDELNEAGVVNPADTVGALRGVIGPMLEEGTDGRASTVAKRLGSENQGTPGGGLLNVIPADDSIPCRETLLALCFDADSFDNRLHEVMKHAEYECPDTKLVILITSKWEPKTWKQKWAVVFENLSAHLVLLLAGPAGLTRVA